MCQFFLLLPLIILQGCQITYKLPNLEGMKSHFIEINDFKTQLFYRLSKKKSRVWNIYIEGDGRSWINKHTIAVDPTPKDFSILKLAIIDRRANTLYLSRPGQFRKITGDFVCSNKFWSYARFSKEVILGLSKVIDAIVYKSTHKNPIINLIGFSGGGGLAVLIAAERKDISTVVTLAGDLHPDALSFYHQTSIQSMSLNPMQVLKNVYRIPQKHYSGENDKIVPKFIAQNFVKKMPKNHKAEQRLIKNLNHNADNWLKFWKSHALSLDDF